MKREEALSLLQDLMVACESMRFAPMVSLLQGSTAGRWKLRVKWVDDDQKGYFKKLIDEHGLVATETKDGYTIFQKP